MTTKFANFLRTGSAVLVAFSALPAGVHAQSLKRVNTTPAVQAANSQSNKASALATPIPDSLTPTAQVKNVGKVQVKGDANSAPKPPLDPEELKRQIIRQLGLPPGADVRVEIQDDGPQLQADAPKTSTDKAKPAPVKSPGDSAAAAAAAATKVGAVTVRGQQAPDFSDPTKTVIGSDQLADPSDRNLLDVLEKQSGIMVRDDGVSLNGLPPSYTQILYDGRKFPAGVSLATLRPEQVERIEISYGADASHGAGGMAGTINVVPKKRISKRSGNVGLNLATGSRSNQAVFASLNDRFAGGSNYSIFGSMSRSDNASGTFSEKLWDLGNRRGHESVRSTGRFVGTFHSLNARSNWLLPDGSWLGAAMNSTRFSNEGYGEDRFASGTTASSLRGSRLSDSGNRSYSPELTWDKTITPKLSLKASARYTDYANEGWSRYDYTQRSGRSESRNTGESISHFADLALTVRTGEGKELQFGGSTESSDDTSRSFVLTSVPGMTDYVRVRETRRDENALFVRWAQRISPKLGLNTGLRWTSLDIKPQNLPPTVQPYAYSDSFLSPSLNLSYRPSLQNTWLFNYSRSFKAPALANLDATPGAPSISDINLPLDAIYRGNAGLRAEVTNSTVVTYSRRWTPTVDTNVNASYRRIGNPLSSIIYNANGLWFRQPVNLDSARYYSISMSGKYWRTFGETNRVTVLVMPSVTKSWNKIDGIKTSAGGLSEFTPLSAFLSVQVKQGAVVGKARINHTASVTSFGGLQTLGYKESVTSGSVGVSWAATQKLIVGADITGIGANQSPRSRTVYLDTAGSMSTESYLDPNTMGPTAQLSVNYRF